MRLRQQPMTFDQFERRFPDGYMAWSVGLALACVVVGIIVFAMLKNTHNEGANQKASYVQALYSGPRYIHDQGAATEALRRSAAKSILRLQNLGVANTNDLSDKDEKQIERTAVTGKPVHFRTSHLKWTKFWDTVLEDILVIYWFLAWGVSLLVYLAACNDCEEETADLPWRYVWPWVYLVLTFLPLGWVIWPISWIKVKSARAKAAADQAEAAARAAEAGEDGGEDTATQEPPLPYHFVSAPQAGKALYIELRQGAWRARLAAAVNDLKSKLDDRKRRLRRMGEDAKTYQREIGEFTSTLAIKERQLDEPQEPLELSKLEEEFERIMRMPGVSGVRILNDMVCLLIKARIKYEGVLYDLGDWELSFGSQLEDLEVECLRSGVNPDWPEGSYPSYGQRHSFCFGVRDTVIREHIRIGQFAEAVSVAIDCMNSVNEGEEHKIPQAFKEVRV